MTNQIQLRLATTNDLAAIWLIIQGAIARRAAEGSNQWQDGYPNEETLQQDIEAGHGFVLADEANVIGYVALLINDEPEYQRIVGKWLTNADFVVFHRVAIAEEYLGKGMAKLMFKEIEKYTVGQGIESIKADTNFDNGPMLNLFEKLGYIYCGEVYFRGSPRKAYEKVLDLSNPA